jgi:ubiquinone/menaquinone biosynthesis C-methylase UbiE
MMQQNLTRKQQMDQIRNAWDAIAPGYDAFVTPSHMRLANQALDHLDLRPGMRFLDVAAGSGALSLAAARRGAEVLGTDISPGMIKHLNDRARQQGLANLEGRVMDGHDLDFHDDSFDAAGSEFGVMLFPDLPRGLSEMARVTRPGGKVLVVTFGPPQSVEFLGFFLKAVHQVVPNFAGFSMDPPPLPFQVSEPARLHDEMASAGLKDVHVEGATEFQEYESAAQLWSWIANSNPIGATLTASLSPEQGKSVRETLDFMLEERAGADGIARLTNSINIAIGTA